MTLQHCSSRVDFGWHSWYNEAIYRNTELATRNSELGSRMRRRFPITDYPSPITDHPRPSMRRAILQAGLLGGAMAVFIGVLTLLPYVGLCLALPLYPMAFFLVGMLVVRLADGVLDVGQAAGGGAAAGVIASVIGGLAAMFLSPIRLGVGGGPDELTRMLSPETLDGLIQRGLDPVMVMDFAGGIGAGIACCATQILTGVMLAALGAALYAAYRRA
jgi:hypothetical protein